MPRRPLESPFKAGTPVIVYAKAQGKVVEDSLREGTIVSVNEHDCLIEYQSFDVSGARHRSFFHCVPGAGNYKRRLGDTGLPTQVYFAEMDEEFL